MRITLKDSLKKSALHNPWHMIVFNKTLFWLYIFFLLLLFGILQGIETLYHILRGDIWGRGACHCSYIIIVYQVLSQSLNTGRFLPLVSKFVDKNLQVFLFPYRMLIYLFFSSQSKVRKSTPFCNFVLYFKEYIFNMESL